MAGGQARGPVNYDLARQLASSSIGFVAPIPDATASAIADAVHLAETWLDGATALPAGTTKAVGVDAQRLDRQHPGHLEAAVRPGGRTDFDGVGLGAARGGQGHGRARCWR